MRRALDRLYAAAMVAAALALVIIASLVLIQISGRIIDRVLLATGGDALGIAVPSLSEIGGFFFVAAAFLALPTTLREAGHVRVTILAKLMPNAVSRVLNIIVLIAAMGLAGFAAWHSWVQVLDSWAFDLTSFGMIPIPLWLPQGAMTLGLIIFAIAILDELVTALTGGTPAFARAEDSRGATDGGH